MTDRQRRLARLAVGLGASMAVAAPLSFVWWRAWMYGGWPGPPGVLRLAVDADGERAYDVVHLEMFLVLTASVIPIVLWALSRRGVAVFSLLGLLGAAVFLLPAALLLGDAVYIGLLAEPSVVADYHFGSESMIGHGGWAYRSRLTYLAGGVLWALGLGAPGLALVLCVRHIRGEAAAGS